MTKEYSLTFSTSDSTWKFKNKNIMKYEYTVTKMVKMKRNKYSMG